MLAIQNISKIGIGTYGIGGRGHRDMVLTEKKKDSVYIDAVAYALEKGLNFAELSLGYGHGNAMHLFAQALKVSGVNRDDVFLTNSFYPRDLPDMSTFEKDLTAFYDIFQTDYADSTLVTESMLEKFGTNVVLTRLHKLLEEGKTRYISLSNANVSTIKLFKQEFGNKFFAHEGHVSFEIRVLQEQEIIQTCNNLGVRNIIWRPLRRNKTAQLKWPLLVKLAQKYNKTQNQIILNWLVASGFYPMVMSTNIKHINENLEALDFKMSKDDLDALNSFRVPNYHPPDLQIDKFGNGDLIVTLVNDFEKHLDSVHE